MPGESNSWNEVIEDGESENFAGEGFWVPVQRKEKDGVS